MPRTTPSENLSPYENLIKFLQENIKFLNREKRRLEQCLQDKKINEANFKQKFEEFQNLIKDRKSILDELIEYKEKINNKYEFTAEATNQIIKCFYREREDLKIEDEKIAAENANLAEEKVATENVNLVEEKLAAENANLAEENKKLKKENAQLKMEIQSLKKQ
ncbi:27085_t:CDS:1, partial [Racocetra persica]